MLEILLTKGYAAYLSSLHLIQIDIIQMSHNRTLQKLQCFASGSPMFVVEFSATSEAILLLLPPTVSRISPAIMKGNGNISGDLEELENKQVFTSGYTKVQNGRGMTAIVTSRKGLGLSSKCQDRAS